MPEGEKIIIWTANYVEASAVDHRAALRPGGSKVEGQIVRQLFTANKQLRLINTSVEYPWWGLTDIPEQRRLHLPKPFALSILLAQIRVLRAAPT